MQAQPILNIPPELYEKLLIIQRYRQHSSDLPTVNLRTAEHRWHRRDLRRTQRVSKGSILILNVIGGRSRQAGVDV